MDNFLNNLRSSVRPVLTYLFAVPFVGLAVYAFVKWGTEQLAFVIISGFIAAGVGIVNLYFQNRNQQVVTSQLDAMVKIIQAAQTKSPTQ